MGIYDKMHFGKISGSLVCENTIWMNSWSNSLKLNDLLFLQALPKRGVNWKGDWRRLTERSTLYSEQRVPKSFRTVILSLSLSLEKRGNDVGHRFRNEMDSRAAILSSMRYRSVFMQVASVGFNEGIIHPLQSAEGLTAMPRSWVGLQVSSEKNPAKHFMLEDSVRSIG